MKILLYSDLHLRPERLKDCDIVLRQVAKLYEEYGCDLMVNLGDTFQTRGIVNTSCLTLLDHHYKDFHRRGIKQVIIVGNHDQEDHSGAVHPMSIFDDVKSWDGWHVVDKPVVIHEIGFCPYMNDLKEDDLPSGVDSLCVHWGIQGARRNDSNVDSDGVPAGWLEKYKRVFSGHYHFRNSFKNIQYVGSPMQQNFGEMGQEKGCLIWDTDTDQLDFVEIEGTKKHYEVEVDPKSKTIKGLSGISAADSVRAKVTGDAYDVIGMSKQSVIEMISEELGCMPDAIQVDRNIIEKSESRIDIEASEIHSLDSLMEKYVEYSESGLDKTKLLKIGREIVGA